MRFCLNLVALIVLIPFGVFSQQKADSLCLQYEIFLRDGRIEQADKTSYLLRIEISSYKTLNALEYLRKVIAITEKYKYPKQTASFYYIIGNIYFEQEMYFQALDYLFQSYRMYRDNGYDYELGYVYVDIGNVYYAQGLYDLSEEYYQNAADVFSKNGDGWGKAVALNNIALINQRRQRWDSAAYYFHQALNIREEMKYPVLIGHSYRYLGQLHRIRKQYEKAEQYLIQGEKLVEGALHQIQIQWRSGTVDNLFFDTASVLGILAEIRETLGLTYFEQGKYKQALQYYQLSLATLSRHFKTTSAIIRLYLAMSHTFKMMQDWKNAEFYALKALDLSETQQHNENKSQALLQLSGIMEDMGKQNESQRYLKQYADLRQKDAETIRFSKISEYQALLKDYEHHVQLRKGEQELKQEKREKLALTIAFIFVTVTAFIVFRLYRSTVRSRRELEEKNKHISEQASALKKAMEERKILSGLLPICASCKKIRDDQGYWHQIESYISSHSEADFSHSICKDCQKKLYPDLFKDEAE